jgi:hypothetical protein
MKSSDSHKLDALIDLMTRMFSTPVQGLPGKDGATGAAGAPAPVVPGDHDLLTKLDTKVDQIQTDINALKDQGSKYITLPQHQELCDAVADHEKRIRNNEKNITQVMTFGSVAIVLVGVIEFIIGHWPAK